MPKTCTLQSPEEEYTKPMSTLTMVLVSIIFGLSLALAVSFTLSRNDRQEFVAAAAKDKEKIEALQAEVVVQTGRVAQYESIKKYMLRVGKDPMFVQGTLAVFVVK